MINPETVDRLAGEIASEPRHGKGSSVDADAPPATRPAKKSNQAKRDQRKRQRERLRKEVAKRDTVITKIRADRDRLRRAIVEHRTTIHNAGTVRVDSRDEPAAEAKHAADQRLWSEISTDPESNPKEG